MTEKPTFLKRYGRRLITLLVFALLLLAVLIGSDTLKEKDTPGGQVDVPASPHLKDLPKVSPKDKGPKRNYDDNYRDTYDPYDYTDLDKHGSDPYEPPKEKKPPKDKDKGEETKDDKPSTDKPDEKEEKPEKPKPKAKGPLGTTTDTLADTLDKVLPGTGPLVKDITKNLDPITKPLDETLKPLNPLTDPLNDLLNGVVDSLLPQAKPKP